MRAELYELLSTDISCKNCGWNILRTEIFKSLQAIYTPLRWLEVPISEIACKMGVAPEEGKKKYCGQRQMGPTYYPFYHEAPTRQNTFHGKLETMKKKASICLDCVRGQEAKPCRFEHD